MKAVIVGTGNVARFTKEILEKCGTPVAGFIAASDNAREEVARFKNADFPLLGTTRIIDDTSFVQAHEFVVALGQPESRRIVFDQLVEREARLANAIHPTA